MQSAFRLLLWSFFLCVLCGVHVSADSSRCSRAGSRQARAILQKFVFPVLAEHDFVLPKHCPFHESNDLFGAQEANKQHQRGTLYQCRVCEKVFREEKYVDKHMGYKHSDLEPPNGVCLVDICDILGCPNSSAASSGLPPSACRPSAMDVRRYECQALLHRCFGDGVDGTTTGNALYEHFNELFCASFTCERSSSLSVKLAALMHSRALYYVLVGFLIIGLVVFYLIVWLSRQDKILQNDLRRLSETRQASRLDFLRRRAPKCKPY